MASAPDPKEASAELARAKQDEAAREAKAARVAIVVWVSLDGVARTLRYSSPTALDFRDLKAAGFRWSEVWHAIQRPGLDDFDQLVAAWWLAGRQAGVDESLEDLLGRTLASPVWVYFPTDEEVAADEADDADPPPSGAGSGP